MDKLKLVLKIYIILSLFFLIIPSYAQLNLELRYIDSIYQFVDVADMPRFKAFLRAYYNNTPINLNVENIIITESNRAYKPFSVLKSGDWYEVKWISQLKGYNEFNYVDFIVTHNNTSAKISGFYTKFHYPKIYIRNPQGQTIQEQHFGTIPEGIQTLRQVKITALRGKLNKDKIEMPVQIDSITLTTPYFTYQWQGNEFDRTPPPIKSSLGSNNLVDIYFKAGSNDFHSDVFTVHYENGFREHLYLTANKFQIDYNPLLKLEQPIGGEILSPCEIYPVKWKGSGPELPIKVYFSSNGGSNWTYLGSSDDSLFHWLVPKTYTNNAKIKIKNEFSKTNQIALNDDLRPIKKVIYSPDGLKILAVYSSGKITEWDTKSYRLINTYYVNNIQNSSIIYNIYGISYLSGDSVFVLAYNQINSNKSDTLAFFHKGISTPFSKIQIDSNFKIKEMIVDYRKNHIALIPRLGNQIAIHSSQDGTFLRHITFDYPIGTMKYHQNGDTAAVYLLNGELLLMKIPEYSIFKRIDFSHLPIILTMSFSSSGKFLALGCKKPIPTPTSISTNEIHVLHLDLNKIVRTLRKTFTDPVKLQFSPNSTVLAIGSEYNPQIAYLDLVSGDYVGAIDITNEPLNDFELSPDGHSLTAVSSGFKNLVIQYFAYPEEYISPGTFSIVEPKIELAKTEFDSSFIGETKEYTITSAVCNIGTTNIRFNSARMKYGVHFYIDNFSDTKLLLPNECLNLKYRFTPLDTGIIRDTIIIFSECYGEFYIPLEKYSKNRNIKLLVGNIDFGEKCVGTINEKIIDLFVNSDPVPLKINYIEFISDKYSPYFTKYSIYDTIIDAESTFSLALIFRPIETIRYDAKLRIYHSNQKKIFLELPVSGKGIGNNLSFSHNPLLFIPEIPERELKIKNNSDHTIKLIEAAFDNNNSDYVLLTTFPISIPPLQETSIKIKWNGTGDKQTKLTFKTEPCIEYFNIFLGRYIAHSIISIPNISADPKEFTKIPIKYINIENGHYSGIRFFNAEIILNKKLFFPTEISSQYGKAEIINNYTDNQFRYIKFRVEGDFPVEGNVTEIIGVAGIADTTYTDISFSDKMNYWGNAISIEFKNGSLQIIGVCKDRLIIHNDKKIQINSIIPNPASEQVKINFYSENQDEYKIMIFNQIGMIMDEHKSYANMGVNDIVLDISHLPPASYKIMVRSNTSFDVGFLVIVR